jgi:hypothetical protein
MVSNRIGLVALTVLDDAWRLLSLSSVSCRQNPHQRSGVGFERSRSVNKKILAAHSFRTGADCRFLVNLGVAKRSFAFYCWLHSRIFGFAAYTVG